MLELFLERSLVQPNWQHSEASLNLRFSSLFEFVSRLKWFPVQTNKILKPEKLFRWQCSIADERNMSIAILSADCQVPLPRSLKKGPPLSENRMSVWNSQNLVGELNKFGACQFALIKLDHRRCFRLFRMLCCFKIFHSLRSTRPVLGSTF